jgi:[acyl-carrier-protein] S-malonyltransferase
MSAIMGLDVDVLRGVCSDAGGICSPANVNAPGQIVISGESEAVERAGVLAKERGALKVIPLKVSAPFHCDLMRPVADDLAAEFPKLSWSAPSVPIVANVDSSKLTSVDSIQSALYSQTYSPVLWADGVLAMESAGVDTFIELGPGSVLSGLIKRICKGRKTVAVNKSVDIAKALEAIGGAVS